MDYCKSVLTGQPKSVSSSPLQRVQNAAAILVCGLGPRDHVTPALSCNRGCKRKFRLIFVFFFEVSKTLVLVTAIDCFSARASLRTSNSCEKALFMSHMCINNIIFSKPNTYFILFLSISTYIHDCIMVLHSSHAFSCYDVTNREFFWHIGERFRRLLLHAKLVSCSSH